METIKSFIRLIGVAIGWALLIFIAGFIFKVLYGIFMLGWMLV